MHIKTSFISHFSPIEKMGDKAGELESRLGPEKFRAVADLRRSMWTGGFSGTAVGLALGFLYSTVRLEKGFGAITLDFPARGKPRALVLGRTLLAGVTGGYLGTQFHGIYGMAAFWRTFLALEEKEKREE